MKKTVIRLLAACLVFAYGSIALAIEDTEKPNYCSQCGAKLVSQGQHIDDWTSTHEVDTGYFVDGKPITTICTISYSVNRDMLVCPNGDGIRWSQDKTKESHSYEKCIDREY